MVRRIYSIDEEENDENSNCESNDGVFDEECYSNRVNSTNNKNCQRRMLNKRGTCTIPKIRLTNKRKKLSMHFQDVFTSLVEMRWRWTFVIFTVSNVASWYIFGILWWIIAYYHGDLKSQQKANGFSDADPCIYGMDDIGTSILFSVEVQSTLGFGSRVPSSKCPEAVFTLLVQIIFGTLLGGILLGLIFTKAARPMARSKAILFSSDVILSWPLTICHKITSSSPLFDMSALEMLQSDFEIMISLSGVMETTGQTLEARTSYLPDEIHWGHRFASVILKMNGSGQSSYIIDYNKFDVIIPVDTPVCSARQIADYSDPNSPMNFFFNQSLDQTQS